jgi:hypothetical protein
MKRQPPLLDQTGASLASPQFTPRPGWGGQLRHWFSNNASSIIFRLVLLFALILVGRAFWVRLPARTENFNTPVVSSPEDSSRITLTANAGDGITNIAARALDVYSAATAHAPRLDAVEHLFAVTTLAATVPRSALEVGQEVSFTTAAIQSVLENATTLTASQKSAWAKFLRR